LEHLREFPVRGELILDHHFKSFQPVRNFYANLHIANKLKPFFRRILVVCPDFPDMEFEEQIRIEFKEGSNVDFTLKHYELCKKYSNRYSVLPVMQFNFTSGEKLEDQLVRQIEFYKHEDYLGVGGVCKFVTNTRHYKLFNTIIHLFREYIPSNTKLHYFGLSLSIIRKFLSKLLRYDLIYSFDSNAYSINSNRTLLDYAEKIREIVVENLEFNAFL